LFAGFWSVLGVLSAGQFYFASIRLGVPVDWPHALLWSLADWYIWAAIAPFLLVLAQRFPLERPRLAGHLAVQVGATIAAAAAYAWLRAVVGWAQAAADDQPRTLASVLEGLLLKSWHLDLLIAWAIVAAGHAHAFQRRSHERALRTAELARRAAELEQGLARARLQSLQAQLNPHFLFNTLHGLSALIHRHPDTAERMVIRLSELLRHALDRAETQTVPLADEIAFLDRYLEIERMRFGERLVVRRELGPGTLGVSVPSLILQPLVENALKHGIEPRARGGVITIRSRLDGDWLELVVADDGPGLRGPPPAGRVGLANTRERLQQLFGLRQHFDLANGPEGGAVVTLRFPSHPEPEPVAVP